MFTGAKLRGLWSSQLFRYLVIGGSTVVIDLGLLVVLKHFFNVNVYLAATISYWTSLVFNFGLNKFWTFDVKNNTIHHLSLYAVLIFINYLTGLAFIDGLGKLGVNYFVAKTAALAVTTVWNYFLYRYVIFVTIEQRQQTLGSINGRLKNLRPAKVTKT